MMSYRCCLKLALQKRLSFTVFLAILQWLETCIDRGYTLSFAGTLTFKNAPGLREALTLVPTEQLLVETDSPFLAPMPHRGAGNTPAQIATIVRAMATERKSDLGELAFALSKNAERLFGSFVP